MLQQTQVERVIPKYTEFLDTFPTLETLAKASLGNVLRAWQGLGYNRRAKMLHAAARDIVDNQNGVFPRTYEELKSLPGVGPYTAGAIMAFAYNKALPIIETNIRTVYLHHFFKNKEYVSDAEILPIITRTLPEGSARLWYAALMDYGTYLKKEYGNQNTRSKHYTKQSAFAGSDRQTRGAILRLLGASPLSKPRLFRELEGQKEQMEKQLIKLLEEGLVVKNGPLYGLPE